MRDKKEAREKFAELRATRLRKRKEEFLTTGCRNCVFNRRVHIKGKGKVRLCANPEVLKKLGRQVFVCEEDIVAQKCPKYQCRKSKDEVEQEFDDILRSPARCGDAYPKLALLIWFLQEQPRGSRWERLKNCTRSVCRSVWHLAMLRWW